MRPRVWILMTLLAVPQMESLPGEETSVREASPPTLEETIAWLRRLDQDYPRPRFNTVTAESLKTLTAITLGGHTKTGHVHFEARDFTYLLPLTELTKLSLEESEGVTDEVLVYIGNLTSLTDLNLGDGQTTDAGMKHLAKLKNLTRLILGANKDLTDVGMAEVVKLKKLETLGISFTKITDATLKRLQELPRLKELWIIGTDVTDEGIRRLVAIKSLTTLYVNTFQKNENVSREALAELVRALPDCKVDPQLRLDRSQDAELAGAWFYNDLEAGYAEARKTGKPLLIVFR